MRHRVTPLAAAAAVAAVGVALISSAANATTSTKAGAALPLASNTPSVLRARGLVYTGLTRATRGACRGLYAIRVSAHGSPACSHGPDPAPGAIDVRRRVPLSALQLRARRDARKAAAAGAIPCGNNDKYAVQAIYAHLRYQGDFSTVSPLLEQYAGDVERVYRESAAETGGTRAVRFVTDANCQLKIQNVTVSALAAASFTFMIQELLRNGFNDPTRKYLVWMDYQGIYCGIGLYARDTTPGRGNENNGRVPLFARVDRPCWGLLSLDRSVEAHELTHTFGAVAATAPHATKYGHCTDAYDTMCYVDGPGTVLHQVCPESHRALLDCNHDDYFSTDPPPGSWLAAHWNTASSTFLIGGGPPPPASEQPPPPTPKPPPPPPVAARCVVPKVKGKPLFEAVTKLTGAHCSLALKMTYSKKVLLGRVVSQRPKPGKVLRAFTPVNLVVSRGHKPPKPPGG